MTIVYVKDDFGFNINFTVKDYGGNALDLSSVDSVILKMKQLGTLSTTVFGLCSISDLSAGTCYYTVQDGDFETIGNYKTEIELDYGPSKTFTAKLADIYITEDL